TKHGSVGFPTSRASFFASVQFLGADLAPRSALRPQRTGTRVAADTSCSASVTDLLQFCTTWQRSVALMVTGSTHRDVPVDGGGMASISQLKCAQCQGSIPEGRTRFCSDFCLATYKRMREREHYGHRHKYRCVECGHEFKVGRHRKQV